MSDFIKICGLRDPGHISACVEAGVSHVGFVFFPKSPRSIDVFAAAKLADIARGRTEIVALVVNPARQVLDDIVSIVRPNAIQFHGAETPGDLIEMRKEVNNSIEFWKAIGVRSKDDIQSALPFAPAVDRFLFDAPPPAEAARPGGHGAAFEWSLLESQEVSKPWFLAGGLTPENVEVAIKAVAAIPGFCGVDVSSGVEFSTVDRYGEKSVEKIQRFVYAARSGFEGTC